MATARLATERLAARRLVVDEWFTIEAAAAKLGIPYPTVRSWIAKSPTRPQHLHPSLRKKARALIASGASSNAIAHRLKLPIEVAQLFFRHGFGSHRCEDLTGKRFGHWLVIERSARRDSADTCYWMCECASCGKILSVSAKSLRMGKSRSCKPCAQKLILERQRRATNLQRVTVYFSSREGRTSAAAELLSEAPKRYRVRWLEDSARGKRGAVGLVPKIDVKPVHGESLPGVANAT